MSMDGRAATQHTLFLWHIACFYRFYAKYTMIMYHLNLAGWDRGECPGGGSPLSLRHAKESRREHDQGVMIQFFSCLPLGVQGPCCQEVPKAIKVARS